MMKKPLVASTAVQLGFQPKVVFAAVEQAMQLANWQKYVKGKNIVLKVNAVWDKIYPSCVTTPMVIEGVILVLKKNLKKSKLTIVDTNTPGMMNATDAFKQLGIQALADRYHIKTVNLSNTDFKQVNLNGQVLKKMKISKVLLKADSIITLPVLKTHVLSTVTLSLKNQWGCIHDLRHQHHLHLREAIADVNKYFAAKIRFAVLDALWGMEGKGPKNGHPLEVGHVFASHDKVALDSFAAKTMGFNPQKIPHIVNAAKNNLGQMSYRLIGDQPPQFQFVKPQSFHLAFEVELFLRKLGKGCQKIFFQGPVFYFMRLAAKIYNDLWYYLIGQHKAAVAFKTRFGQMWTKYLD
ncbi:MAG: DUF362 domain-containing protein [Candidatus Pacebacteria bacterium]|nr:DUF362 domain-containing protein [Candidatus Paceibacterota bacterium]